MTIGNIAPFRSITDAEIGAAVAAMEWPLSGYLAGHDRGGPQVCALETEWAESFLVKHAIAVNSATSGLMAAAFAIGLKPGDRFLCPALTMSATAAAPMFTGAVPVFADVSERTFGLSLDDASPGDVKAVFATHLFGIVNDEDYWLDWARRRSIKIVIDASQAPFMRVHGGAYAGTIGDIGVFSLNVHKPLNCGEGGIVVTNDDHLALRIRRFINHGENLGSSIGLNLRLPEICAAIARVQFRRGHEIIDGRIRQARAIMEAIGEIVGITSPDLHGDHVYYTIPFTIEINRKAFCAVLREEGVPVVEGYVPPLYRLPAFWAYARWCPNSEFLHDDDLFYIENCAWTFTPEQIAGIGEAFRKAAEKTL